MINRLLELMAWYWAKFLRIIFNCNFFIGHGQNYQKKEMDTKKNRNDCRSDTFWFFHFIPFVFA